MFYFSIWKKARQKHELERECIWMPLQMTEQTIDSLGWKEWSFQSWNNTQQVSDSKGNSDFHATYSRCQALTLSKYSGICESLCFSTIDGQNNSHVSKNFENLVKLTHYFITSRRLSTNETLNKAQLFRIAENQTLHFHHLLWDRYVYTYI